MAGNRPETQYARSSEISIAYQVYGSGSIDTVNIAARIGALAGPCEVLVSRTVRDLVVGSELALRDADTHALKGVPDSWQLFALADGD